MKVHHALVLGITWLRIYGAGKPSGKNGPLRNILNSLLKCCLTGSDVYTNVEANCAPQDQCAPDW